MERSGARLLDASQFSFDNIRSLSACVETTNRDEWSGRFWLPTGNRVEPIHTFCLLRRDGRAGEMIMDRFALNETERRAVLAFP